MEKLATRFGFGKEDINMFIDPNVKQYNKGILGITKMLRKFPNQTNLIIKCFACHGMIMDGR